MNGVKGEGNVAEAGSPRRRVPRKEREEQMLAVALPLFAKRGYHDVSVDEVAAGAGVTKPMVYAYFGSKEGLFEACANRAADRLVAATIGVGRLWMEHPAEPAELQALRVMQLAWNGLGNVMEGKLWIPPAH